MRTPGNSVAITIAPGLSKTRRLASAAAQSGRFIELAGHFNHDQAADNGRVASLNCGCPLVAQKIGARTTCVGMGHS